MKIPPIIIATAGTLLLIGVGYWWTSQSRTPSPTPTTVTPTSTLSAVEEQLRAGGSSYLDKSGTFSFLYPSDYKLDTQGNDQYTRIVKIGATQKGQTEIYDGVLMIFEGINLGDQSLEQWVDTKLKEATADGSTKITTPKHVINSGKYTGFGYTTQGFGGADTVVVQKDPSSQYAVNISILVADPENMGYQSEVDAVLTTIELLK